MNDNRKITKLTVRDIRFPTSLNKDGSDAIMKNPDYSCAYVVITTDDGLEGYGFTFTVGRGTQIVCTAVEAYSSLVVGQLWATSSVTLAATGKNWLTIHNSDGWVLRKE